MKKGPIRVISSVLFICLSKTADGGFMNYVCELQQEKAKIIEI